MTGPRPFRLTEDVRPEHELQAALAGALAYRLPQDAVFNSWDLANSRSAIEGARKKWRGCLPGWPDCSVWWDGRVVLLELKRPGAYLSPSQRALHARLAAAGHPVAVAHDEWEAMAAIEGAGIPLRGRAA